MRRQPRSTAMIAEAAKSLAGGATSNWQIAQPQAVWMSHGEGSHVWDVDGNEYVDMHGGYGAAIAGHGHPAIVEAVSRQVARGTHFAQPTEDAIWVAEELKRRFGLPMWRFANSGTEATMDAVHLMRALTERDLVIKVEGCYHGHHDSVQVSVLPEPEEVGPADAPYNVPGNTGIPQAIIDLIVVVPFNDLGAVERALAAHRGRIAGMILEPIMMNAGIIPPDDGYLAGLKDLLHAEGAYLTFDEVKTGFTTGPAGATGTVRRHARHRLPRQGPGRRHLGRRDRRHRRGDVGRSPTGGTSRSARSTATRWRWPRPAPTSPTSSTTRVTPTSTRWPPGPRDGFERHIAAERPAVAGGQRRGQGLRRLHRRARAQLPRLPRGRRPLGQPPLALAAQWGRVPPTVGQGRAVAAVGAAHRGRRRPAGRQLRASWPRVAGRHRGRLMPGGALRLASLTKSFGDVVAVDGIDLDLPGR